VRCYPLLLESRKNLYEKYADVEIDYFERREDTFSLNDFLTNLPR